jgi:hypothetical protein
VGCLVANGSLKINEIQEKGNILNNGDDFTKNINGFGINSLLKFFDIEEDYEDDPDDFDIEDEAILQ